MIVCIFLHTIQISMNENKDNQDNIKPKNWDRFLELVKTMKIND